MRRLGSSLVCVGLAASPPSIHMSVSYVVVSPGAFGAMMNNGGRGTSWEALNSAESGELMAVGQRYTQENWESAMGR